MADAPNASNQNKLGPPAEPSIERRLLLAFLLMGGVLFVTPYFYKAFVPQPAARPPAKTTQPAKPAEAPPPAAASEPAAAPAPEPAEKPAAPAEAVAADAEKLFVVDTSLYHVVLSNKGALVRSWTLKKYRDNGGKALELVSAPGSSRTGYPFAITLLSKQKPSTDPNQALYAAKPSPDGLGVDYAFSDGRLAVRKSFRFERDVYLSEFTSEVSVNGAGQPHLVNWRGGFGDATVQNAAGNMHSLFFDLASGKLVIKSAKDAKDGPVTDSGTYSFAGVEDNYFAAVFLPRADQQVTIQTVSDNVPGAVDQKEQPHVGAEVGGKALNRFAVFVGPKDVDLLKKIDPKLEQMVDFGWFSFLAKPLFLILNYITDHLVHNYGWSIVVVTILINFLLLPLRLSSMKSMKRMQALQPQIQAIQARYKNVGLRDPRKAEQNQELMDLYKKHGVNPMGGCLPMLLQLPLFIAFYKVLYVAIEMRGARWLWVTDLSQPEQLPIHILPIAMIVAQFVMQKMTPTPSADPNQQRMMLLMPLVFGFMFYSASSGLVLYWLTSNLVGIVQQWLINRSMPAPAAPAPAEPAPKRQKSGSRK